MAIRGPACRASRRPYPGYVPFISHGSRRANGALRPGVRRGERYGRTTASWLGNSRFHPKSALADFGDY